MKSFVYACVVLFVGAFALPQPEVKDVETIGASRNIITDVIAGVIEELSDNIRALGLDPFIRDELAYGYALPVPVLFNARAYGDDVEVIGASDIVINSMNFGILTTRLTFDISIPELIIAVREAGLDATVFSTDLSASYSGRVAIKNARITGDVRVNVGIISGISVRDLSLGFRVDRIDSQITKANLFGFEMSNFLNSFLTVNVPRAIDSHASEISELLELVVMDVIDDLL